VSNLLKAALVLCLGYSLLRIVEFGYAHLPPHSAGECFEIPSVIGLTVKVDENYPLQGYSDVTINYAYKGYNLKEKSSAGFVEQRQDFGVKVKCL
jgi:hypothetical protein